MSLSENTHLNATMEEDGMDFFFLALHMILNIEEKVLLPWLSK